MDLLAELERRVRWKYGSDKKRIDLLWRCLFNDASGEDDDVRRIEVVTRRVVKCSSRRKQNQFKRKNL